MKTIVRRKTGPARSDEQERKTLATKKRISLAEMSITQISFIQHIHGNLQ